MSAAAAEVTGLRYGRAIRRWWHVIAVLTLLGMAAGYLTSQPKPHDPLVPQAAPTSDYSATALLMFVGAGSNGDPSGLSLDAIAYFATTGEVPRMVAKQLHYAGAPSALASQVQVTPNDQVAVLQISATEPNGPEAVRLVKAFDRQVILYLDQQIRSTNARQQAAVQAQLQNLQTEVSKLQTEPSSPLVHAELTAAQSQYSTEATQYADLKAAPLRTTLSVVQPPVAVPGSAPKPTGTTGAGTTGASTSPATTPSHSKIPQGRVARTALGGAVGLLLGLALALLLDRFDRRLFGRREVEDAFGLPVLAELSPASRYRQPVVAARPFAAASETYRRLQASLAGATVEAKDLRVILVAALRSATSGGVVVANLAMAFADAGEGVVVLVADPSSLVPALLAGRGSGGVTRVGEPVELPAVGPGELSVVAPESGETPGAWSARMVAAVEEAGDHRAVVLVDAAPVLTGHGASRLAPVSDAVLLVAEEGRDRTNHVREALSLLTVVRAPIAGVALIGRSRKPAVARTQAQTARGRHTVRRGDIVRPVSSLESTGT